MGKSLSSLEELEQVSSNYFRYASIEATAPLDGYNYDYRFHVGDEKRTARIGISTKEREIFLEKGSELQAQEALINLARGTRELSGGVFDIHPFYGAVYGTKITPVAPGFMIDLEQLDENLSVNIWLSDKGYEFDDASTKEAMAIGTTIEIPGPKSRRFLDYLKTHKSNPNQENRDQAIANGLGEKWDEEFQRFNGQKPTLQAALEINPKSIVGLMRELGHLAIVEDVRANFLDTVEDDLDFRQ